jgi:hypothetical protein
MNENTSTQYTEFVWRRLSEPVRVFGTELPPWVWLVVLITVLAVAFFYVGWMYRKDARGVGLFWATFLGLLRAGVYAILALVFLLPAVQSGEKQTFTSKVVLGFDVSGSMDTRDDIPGPNQKWDTLKGRQDKLLDFLKKEDGSFMKDLLANNPVTVYRFSSRLDDDFWHFADKRTWAREEWEGRNKGEGAGAKKPPEGPWPEGYWSAWLKPWVTPLDKVPAEFDEAESERYQATVLASNERRNKQGDWNGTNVWASTYAALEKEKNNLLQGIVVFSDGHSTSVSNDALTKLQDLAKNRRIPIFVVGIGQDRPQVRKDINGIRAPTSIRPDDRFRVVPELIGEGLADKPENELILEIQHIGTKKKNKADVNGKEEELDIVLVETLDKKDTTKTPEVIVLGKKLLLQPPEPVKYNRDNPPRAEPEFQLDAATLAKAAGIDLQSDKYRGRKWEIGITKQDPAGLDTSEIRFTVRVKKDILEIYPHPEHVSKPVGMQVIKKELSVLLFASSACRDYQFLRTLMHREFLKGRAKLAVYIQKPPGATEIRMNIMQDVPKERLLKKFPDSLDGEAVDEASRVYDLAEYDVIVCFDPDWNELDATQLQLLERWVDKGGGLIALGGPVNTLQLARPGDSKKKLTPIIELYPVVLKDVRIEEVDRKLDTPWPLVLDQATPEMEFLHLREDATGSDFAKDWKDFYGKSEEEKSGVVRGFYGYYPTEQVRTGALVAARYGDPDSKMKDSTLQPFIVLSDPSSGRRTAWIASCEMWRLRMYSEAFHERFWTKLIRYAGAGSTGKSNRNIDVLVARSFKANQFVDVQATITGKSGEPLKDAHPLVKLTLPDGVTETDLTPIQKMNAKVGYAGLYTAKFLVRAPGNYKVEVTVPEIKDTSAPKEFQVEEAKPETDNTRPDFASLYEMASDATEVLARIKTEADRDAVQKALQKVHTFKAEEGKPSATTTEKTKLFFDLTNADLIPRCMINLPQTSNIRGPIRDYWDDGFTIKDAQPPDKPIKISYVLLIVVGLLSLEWLTRKLLRLA